MCLQISLISFIDISTLKFPSDKKAPAEKKQADVIKEKSRHASNHRYLSLRKIIIKNAAVKIT